MKFEIGDIVYWIHDIDKKSPRVIINDSSHLFLSLGLQLGYLTRVFNVDAANYTR